MECGTIGTMLYKPILDRKAWTVADIIPSQHELSRPINDGYSQKESQPVDYVPVAFQILNILGQTSQKSGPMIPKIDPMFNNFLVL
jgi:hypothetical protein